MKASFSRAIIHIDGDAFFASCEQAVEPALRGKPVVTGAERGIVSAASYEAKALGVTRAMKLTDVKKLYPQCIIVPSNYELYGIFSTRMFSIVRRYTSEVEEYSIDECFAEITGLRRPLRMSYEKIAQVIKEELEEELGITVSIGLGPTKVMAKIASKLNKPSGLFVLSNRIAQEVYKDLAVDKIWGIGTQTSGYLSKKGVRSIKDFVMKDQQWIEDYLAKPYQELWWELNGTNIMEISTEKKVEYKSISKTKTFAPPSKSESFIFAQLSKNIENACIKARRFNLRSKYIFLFLKTQDFRCRGVEIDLTNEVNTPGVIISMAREHFEEMYKRGVMYRATGCVLMRLSYGGVQPDLFGDSTEVEKLEKVFESVDKIDKKYGKHTVSMGSSFAAIYDPDDRTNRGTATGRSKIKLKGEMGRRRINVPFMGAVV